MDTITLRPGDEVALSVASYSSGHTIEKVRSVSGRGVVTLENGLKFDKHGTQITSDRYGKRSITEVTDGIRAQIKRDARVHFLKSAQWDKADDELLEAVIATLHAHGQARLIE